MRGMGRISGRAAVVTVMVASLIGVGATSASALTTTRLVSVNNNGDHANFGANITGVSADGHYVAFASPSTNLVPNGGDTNNHDDIFVYDRVQRTVARVSVKTDGSQGYPAYPQSGGDGPPKLSADGRFVTFATALQLVAGDTNDQFDVYVRDRDADEDGIMDETDAATTTLMATDDNGSPGAPYYSLYPDISGDGRYVSFQSADTNLVPADTNGRDDVFVHDRDTDQDGIFDEPGAISTTRVSVDSAGNAGSDFSGLGRISSDGRYLSFLTINQLTNDDQNNIVDVYVRDRDTDTDGIFDEPGQVETFRASALPGGGDLPTHPQSADISASGNWVAFQVANAPSGAASQLVYAFDVNSRTTTLVRNLGVVSVVISLSISGDGSTIVSNDSQGVVAIDRASGSTQPASVYSNGSPAPGRQPEISADGRFVTFWSDTNLVPSDQNVGGTYMTDLNAPPRTIPAAPTNVHAEPGNASATVTWSAPDDGGSPVQYFTITVSPPDVGPFDLNLSTMQYTVTGLTPGTPYTFSVKATNSIGTGPPATSNQVVPTGVASFPLTVSKSGNGDGTVSNGGGQISCDPTCSANFTSGSTVNLTATADSFSTFSGWSGSGCSGNAGCSVLMDQSRSVTAEFTSVAANLAVTGSVGPTFPSVGNDVVYTLQVTNNGPASASNVNMTDVFAGTAVYASASPSQGSCSRTGTTVSCSLGTLASGASTTIVVTVTPINTTTMSNTASVTSGAPDPVSSNNQLVSSTPIQGTNCTMVGTQGNDTLSGGNAADVICGLGGLDSLNGNGNGDLLIGGSGNDGLHGGAGDDQLFGGLGGDQHDGASGSDTARYDFSSSPIVSNLSTASGEGADTMFGTGMENMTGSRFNDSLTGNSAANVLSGGPVSGANGDDVLTGGGQADTLYGYAGNDTLLGGDQNDLLFGGLGDDSIDGGLGTDWLRYDPSPAAVTVDLAVGATGEGSDTFPVATSIEYVLGSAFNDVITGNSLNNKLYGGNGDDRLFGLAGIDNLFGENGNDYLDGGDGTQDTCSQGTGTGTSIGCP
jgi:uncharacterized repeat protein (TIGR01451 family)